MLRRIDGENAAEPRGTVGLYHNYQHSIGHLSTRRDACIERERGTRSTDAFTSMMSFQIIESTIDTVECCFQSLLIMCQDVEAIHQIGQFLEREEKKELTD